MVGLDTGLIRGAEIVDRDRHSAACAGIIVFAKSDIFYPIVCAVASFAADTLGARPAAADKLAKGK